MPISWSYPECCGATPWPEKLPYGLGDRHRISYTVRLLFAYVIDPVTADKEQWVKAKHRTLRPTLAMPTNVPGFWTWRDMNRRCYDPRATQYKDYGGRGIGVCSSWRDDPWQFLEDVGPQPRKGFTLERLNNDGNYEPGNCVWTDRKTQARNKRSNSYFELQGERLTLSQVSERYGVCECTLRDRMYRAGMSLDEAISKPVGRQGTSRQPKKTKLTPQQVRQIKFKIRLQHLPVVRVARSYGVAPATINQILRGETYKYV